MLITDYIPREKFQQFHEIICRTGGRYLRDPLILFQTVEVHYEPGDYTAQCQAWAACVTPISEVRRDQWWRKLLRRVGL